LGRSVAHGNSNLTGIKTVRLEIANGPLCSGSIGEQTRYHRPAGQIATRNLGGRR
jgi:hypothetical protein